MGDIEMGFCCGKEAQIHRKYYHYDLICTCCGGNTHFEIVYYCNNCSPKEPNEITYSYRNEKYTTKKFSRIKKLNRINDI